MRTGPPGRGRPGTKLTTARSFRTYVVNLRRRLDRRLRMGRNLPRELPVTYTSDWQLEFDGRQLSRPALERTGYGLFPWQIASGNPWWDRPLKLGEIGCAIAHLACWHHAVRSGAEPYALILEDDVSLEAAFVDRLMAGVDRLHRERIPFHLLYLGRCPVEPDRPLIPSFVAPGYSHCTFGYVLTRFALEVLLEQRLDRAMVPVDEFLPSLYTDHPRHDLRCRFPRRLLAVAFESPLVRQLPKEEAGSDTEDSRFV